MRVVAHLKLVALSYFGLASALLIGGGCQTDKLRVIPANEVRSLASEAKNPVVQRMDYSALRQASPKKYSLDHGDVLGIFVEHVTGDTPPVFFPEGPGDPAIGYPVAVRRDGTIALPDITPVDVRGLRLSQVEAKIRQAYSSSRTREANHKIVVSLIRRRPINIVVIRQDVGDDCHFSFRRNELSPENGGPSRFFAIELDASSNDVFHALTATGGLPGEKAGDEILILRGAASQGIDQREISQAIVLAEGDSGRASIVRIPTRGSLPTSSSLAEEDITLGDGDVVYVGQRPPRVFYTGGLWPNGRHALPFESEVDILEALDIAGINVSNNREGGPVPAISKSPFLPASKVMVLRRENGQQCVVEVDLRKAQTDPAERIIIQPGDMLMLEYRPHEQVANSVAHALKTGSQLHSSVRRSRR